MEECDQTAKQLRSNADLLELVCKDRLHQLHHDKQRARKSYQEEHQKITTQFNTVCITSWAAIVFYDCVIDIFHIAVAERGRHPEEGRIPKEPGLLQNITGTIRRALHKM